MFLDVFEVFEKVLMKQVKVKVGDKVSVLTHTYPHKLLRKIKVTICNHQVDSPLYVWPDVWSGDMQFRKSMVTHDTECPYWDQVSLNNTNPNPTLYSPSSRQILLPLQLFPLARIQHFNIPPGT